MTLSLPVTPCRGVYWGYYDREQRDWDMLAVSGSCFNLAFIQFLNMADETQSRTGILLKQKYVKEMTLINYQSHSKIPNLLLKNPKWIISHFTFPRKGALLLWINRRRWYLNNETVVGFPKEGNDQNEQLVGGDVGV